ncbi:phage replisome organizer N-terminal domain-containing protein [Streptococcus uberis]
MKKTKIYFWLKVDKKFFDNIFIKRLKSVQGGYAMTVIYIRLMLESLSSDCILYYEGYFENLTEELALKLDVSEDDINQTLAYFTRCGLIQIDSDNNAYMQQAEAMVQQETDQASYMRNYRKQKKLERENLTPSNTELTLLNSCKTEIESKKETEIESKKEIEIESKKEKEKEKEIEIKSNQNKDIYIDNFDRTSDFSTFTKIEDYLGENYLTDLSDSDFIKGLTYFCFNRQADQYEINTLKKRLNTIDRKLLEEAYYLASLNEANTLGYVVAILNKWEELNIRTYAEFEEHEYQHVKGNDESPF